MDWDTFQVEEAVLHYVPTGRDDGGDEPDGLVLTDSLIALDDPLRTYFRDRIAGRLAGKGMDVVTDPDGDPTVPRAVESTLGNAAALVEQSKVIARHLHAIQSSVNSSGLLAVIFGRLGNAPCVAVIKLEPERGVQFAITDTDGTYTVDLELLRNLTLTDRTKVYKTALMRHEDQTVTGWVADDQRSTATGSSVATFFLSRFLGCTPRQPAAITTYKFVQAASASFNTDVDSAKLRSRYQVALLSVMQDNTTTITPKAFADKHLAREERPAFLQKIEDAGIAPTATFAKDTSRVDVSRFTMTFTDGNLTLVGDRTALEEIVEIPDDDAGDEPVRLNTTVDDIITGK